VRGGGHGRSGVHLGRNLPLLEGSVRGWAGRSGRPDPDGRFPAQPSWTPEQSHDRDLSIARALAQVAGVEPGAEPAHAGAEEPRVRTRATRGLAAAAGGDRRRWRPPPRARIPRRPARAGSAAGRGHPAVLDRAPGVRGSCRRRASARVDGWASPIGTGSCRGTVPPHARGHPAPGRGRCPRSPACERTWRGWAGCHSRTQPEHRPRHWTKVQ
jgi:hypothetical protein